VKDRTRAINAVKMLFSTRGEDLPLKDLTTLKVSKWLSEREDLVIKHYGKALKEFTQAINELEKK
jgi:hypothetical protein